jgi:hypothetical protein
VQDQRPRLEDFTIKRVALGLPPGIVEVTGRSERSGPDTYPIRDLNQLSRPHAVNQWVTRSPRNDTPPSPPGPYPLCQVRRISRRTCRNAGAELRKPNLATQLSREWARFGAWGECDHLNWPRFGLLSSRISARLGGYLA